VVKKKGGGVIVPNPSTCGCLHTACTITALLLLFLRLYPDSCRLRSRYACSEHVQKKRGESIELLDHEDPFGTPRPLLRVCYYTQGDVEDLFKAGSSQVELPCSYCLKYTQKAWWVFPSYTSVKNFRGNVPIVNFPKIRISKDNHFTIFSDYHTCICSYKYNAQIVY
jgi:hypothetical protein